MKCAQCGKEFEPSRNYQKCCSSECSEKNVKRLMEQYNKKMQEQRTRQKLELQAAREKAKAKLERYYQDKELPKELPVTVLSPDGTSRSWSLRLATIQSTLSENAPIAVRNLCPNQSIRNVATIARN